MRRRNQLRGPDTFPFLAVLLCAMGSLILVLMELDRRARSAANGRAETAWKKQEEEKAELLARLRAQRLAEQERLRQQRQARLDAHHAEQQDLRRRQDSVAAERQDVLSRAEAVWRGLEKDREDVAALERRREDERRRGEEARQT